MVPTLLPEVHSEETQVNVKMKRQKRCFSESDQEMLLKVPRGKELSGQVSLVKDVSCRTSLKIPKACWHTRDSQKTCK